MFARDDTTVAHEETDTMIIQQVASVGAANILIVADDTCIWACVTLCKTMTSVSHCLLLCTKVGNIIDYCSD